MSYVTTLTTDTETVQNPTWANVESNILALDSDTHSLVMLAPMVPGPSDDMFCHMAIGGGAHDNLIVYTSSDNVHFWNLIDPNQADSEDMMSVLIGGQIGEYKTSQFVSRRLALLAARQYFDDGTRAPNLVWREG